MRNLFNSSRAFFHKCLKWRSYSPFAFMLFCNLTPLHGSFVNAIVFCRKSEFCEYIISYTHNIQFMYDSLNFSFLLWNKLHLYFVTFLLPVSIYNKAQNKLQTKKVMLMECPVQDLNHRHPWPSTSYDTLHLAITCYIVATAITINARLQQVAFSIFHLYLNHQRGFEIYPFS